MCSSTWVIRWLCLSFRCIICLTILLKVSPPSNPASGHLSILGRHRHRETASTLFLSKSDLFVVGGTLNCFSRHKVKCRPDHRIEFVRSTSSRRARPSHEMLGRLLRRCYRYSADSHNELRYPLRLLLAACSPTAGGKPARLVETQTPIHYLNQLVVFSIDTALSY